MANWMSRPPLFRLFLLFLAGGALCLGAYYFGYPLLSAFFEPRVTSPSRVPMATGGTSNVDIIMKNRWKTAYRETVSS